MFGRNPRLPIDVEFGILLREENATDFAQNLPTRLHKAYDLVTNNPSEAAKKQKRNYDTWKVRGMAIDMDDIDTADWFHWYT